MKQRNPRLAKFVRGYGARRIAAALGINPRNLYFYLAGTFIPRQPLAQAMVELAGTEGYELTLEDLRTNGARPQRSKYRWIRVPAEDAVSEPAPAAEARP